jgi:PhoPQ-activated pathogenicity-related protein
MNLNFHNKLNKFIMIYIDDILIYFKLTKKLPNIKNSFYKSFKIICLMPTEQIVNLQGWKWIFFILQPKQVTKM